MNSSSFMKSVFIVLLMIPLAFAAQDAAQAGNPATAPTGAQANTAPQQPASEPAEGETVHVLVGKSIVINVQQPMTRVLSSNPAAVETMATSPTQIVVEGKAAGASSLILWDQSGRSQVLDVVTDLDVGALRNAIQKSYPKENIQLEADAGHLLLTGTASNPRIVEDIGKMASVYSKDVVNSIIVPLSHDRQVLLEVKFAEVDRTATTQLGVNLFSTGAGNTIGTTTTGQFGGFGQQNINDTFPRRTGSASTAQESIGQVLNVFLFRPDIHFGAVIQALQAHNALQILAEPNLMVINGQKATFLAGGEFPFPVVQPGQGFTSVSIQFKPFGVKLEFTGTVLEDNTVRLHVFPEVSTLDFANGLVISGFNVPAVSTRRAETEIELKDGQPFGIAGLLDNRATVQLSKIPGIGDIPILGQLFRSRNISKSNTELLVFVTPHIVDPVRVATTAPKEPSLTVPFMDKKKFDENSPGNKEVNAPQGTGAK